MPPRWILMPMWSRTPRRIPQRLQRSSLLLIALASNADDLLCADRGKRRRTAGDDVSIAPRSQRDDRRALSGASCNGWVVETDPGEQLATRMINEQGTGHVFCGRETQRICGKTRAEHDRRATRW